MPVKHLKMIRGTYQNKPIRAVVEDGVVIRFEFVNEPGNWYFPLIENGQNVERDKFILEEQEEVQLSFQFN